MDIFSSSSQSFPTLRTETIIRHVILPRAFRPASLLRFLPLRPHRPSLSSPSTGTAAQPPHHPPPPNAPSTALFHLESDLLSPFSLPLHRRKFGPRTPRTVIDSCLEIPLPATAEQKFPMYMTDRGARSGGFFWCYLGGPKVFCPALRWWGFGRFTLLLFYLRCVF